MPCFRCLVNGKLMKKNWFAAANTFFMNANVWRQSSEYFYQVDIPSVSGVPDRNLLFLATHLLYY